MADNVKVAVRVRPFNQREKDRNAKCVIRMDKTTQQTMISDPETGKEHDFRFDFSYNSFVDRDHSEYASQLTLWHDIGVGILENAYEGYNCSLFAYGQTGAGKSYSMMGYGPDKGIIPIACEKIFDNVDSNTDPNLTIKVEASMLEIYMEKIRDLFNPREGTDLKVRKHPKQGFYVQGLTKNAVGSFEQISHLMDVGTKARTVASTNMNATSSRAHTVFQILLTQTKVDPELKKATDKTAVINLIDLAGSERADSTGATGARLKEGSAINLSLTSLGNCISALAKNSGGGKKKVVPYRDSVLTMLLQNSLGGNAKTIMIAALSPADINYAETLSTLRYADRAKQIKNMATVNEDPNQKLIRSLREEIEALKRSLAGGGGVVGGDGAGAGAGAGGGGGGSFMSTMGVKVLAAASAEQAKEAWMKSERERMEQELAEKIKQEIEETKPWEERLRDTEALREKREKELSDLGVATGEEMEKQLEMAKTTPHLVNLHEDPMLSEQVRYFVPDGSSVKIGRKDGEDQDVVLDGLGISKEHCILESSPTGSVTIRLANPEAKVCVNGKPVEGVTSVPLHVGYRVILGNNHVFKVCIPSELEAGYTDENVSDPAVVDWGFAIREQNRLEIEMVKEREAEHRRELEAEKARAEQELVEFREKIEREQAKAEEEARTKRELFAKKQKEIIALKMKSVGREALRDKEERLAREQEAYEAALRKKQEAMDRQLREQQELTERIKLQQQRAAKFRTVLEEQLVDTLVKVNEANMLSAEMDCGVKCFIKLMEARHVDAETAEALQSKHADSDADSISGDDEEQEVAELWEGTQIYVKITHIDDAQPPVFFPREKFLTRLYQLRQMFEEYSASGREPEAVAKYTGPKSPFYAPPQDQLVGRATVYLESLRYLFNITMSTPIIDYKRGGLDAGRLNVRVAPHLDDRPPAVLSDDDAIADSLEELIGKTIYLTVFIDSAVGLPADYSKNVFVQFKPFPQGRLSLQWQKTPVMKTKSVSPEFDYRHTFRTTVTEELIKFVSTEALELEVWGTFEKSALPSPTHHLLSPRKGVEAVDPDVALEKLTRALHECEASGVPREAVMKAFGGVYGD